MRKPVYKAKLKTSDIQAYYYLVIYRWLKPALPVAAFDFVSHPTLPIQPILPTDTLTNYQPPTSINNS